MYAVRISTISCDFSEVSNSEVYQMSNSPFFAAGAVFGQVSGQWCVWGITTQDHPNQVKLPGGVSGPRDTVPEDCLRRELREEVGIEAWQSFSVYESGTEDHQKHFFVVLQWSESLISLSASLERREGIRSRSFPDIANALWRRESDGDYIWPRPVSLGVFWEHCFSNHRAGFQKAAQVYLYYLRELGSDYLQSFRDALIEAQIPHELS